MSVRIMTLVFDRFKVPGNDKVLALTLADHAHDDGTNIFPGVERLAEKTCMSTRTVIRLLQKFVEIGWLIKTRNADSRRGMAAIYRISPEWINGSACIYPNVEKPTPPIQENNDSHESLGDRLSPKNDHENSQTLGDKMSPNKSDVLGDKSKHWVTNRAVLGDIAVSPQPSLTINTTINTACATHPDENNPSMKPEGLYACRLIKLNVGVTSMHPTLHAWIRDGITLEQLVECVGIARQQKPEPERIAPNYLDKIVRSQLKPKADNSWLMSDDGVLAKGREVGLLPKVGESMQDYRARVKQAVLGGDGKAA